MSLLNPQNAEVSRVALTALGLMAGAAIPTMAAETPSEVFQINMNIVGKQLSPDVGRLQDGTFMVTWGSPFEPSKPVSARRFHPDGKPYGTEVLIQSVAKHYFSQPPPSPIAQLFPSGYIIIWNGDDPGFGYGVFGQRFDINDKTLGSVFPINTETIDHQSRPRIVYFPKGGYVVIWESADQDGSGYGIFGQRFNKDLTKFDREFQINNYTDNDQQIPDLIGLSNTNFLVTWCSQGQKADANEIIGRIYTPVGQGDEFVVNKYTMGNQCNPSAASLSNGGFLVTWSGDRETGSGKGVSGRIFDTLGTPSTDDFPVDSQFTSGGSPSATSLLPPEEGFIVVWRRTYIQPQPTRSEIIGQKLGADGSKLGDSFLITPNRTYYRLYPKIAPLLGGGFVVVWQSDEQDGDSWGIFGRVFPPGYPASSTQAPTTSTIPRISSAPITSTKSSALITPTISSALITSQTDKPITPPPFTTSIKTSLTQIQTSKTTTHSTSSSKQLSPFSGTLTTELAISTTPNSFGISDSTTSLATKHSSLRTTSTISSFTSQQTIDLLVPSSDSFYSDPLVVGLGAAVLGLIGSLGATICYFLKKTKKNKSDEESGISLKQPANIQNIPECSSATNSDRYTPLPAGDNPRQSNHQYDELQVNPKSHYSDWEKKITENEQQDSKAHYIGMNTVEFLMKEDEPSENKAGSYDIIPEKKDIHDGYDIGLPQPVFK